MTTTYNKPLGTPLSPAATRVMLLGSGELGKEVLIALQRLGVETIAVDRYENAPGQQVAHHAHTITMSDQVALRALIERSPRTSCRHSKTRASCAWCPPHAPRA
jgi:phosphoribosylglycinamide formyltransferase 2